MRARRDSPRRAGIALAAVACVLVVGLLAARIWFVNDAAGRIETRDYGTGQWADATGPLRDEDETMRDYGFKVEKLEVMSPNEYLRRYGKDGTKALDDPDADVPCVGVVTMRIRNAGEVPGYAFLSGWRLTPDSNDDTYELWTELYAHHDKATAEGFGSVRPGTEVVTYMPFSPQEDTAWSKPGDIRRPAIRARDFHMTITREPVQRTFLMRAS